MHQIIVNKKGQQPYQLLLGIYTLNVNKESFNQSIIFSKLCHCTSMDKKNINCRDLFDSKRSVTVGKC